MNRRKEFKTKFEQINCLDLEAVDYPVELIMVDKEEIKVTFNGLSDLDIVSSVIENHTFIVRQTVQRSLRVFLGFIHFCGKIVVELPKKFHGSLNIKTCNGSIKTSNVFDGNEITFTTSNGSIHVYGLKCDSALFTTKNGSIEMEQIVAEKMTFDTRNGSIKGMIMGKMEDFNIESHTVNGSNNLPSRMISSNKKKSLLAKTCNGRIAVDFMSL